MTVMSESLRRRQQREKRERLEVKRANLIMELAAGDERRLQQLGDLSYGELVCLRHSNPTLF